MRTTVTRMDRTTVRHQDRFMIVNADDLGRTRSRNQAIAAAFRHRLISSTTILVNMETTHEAIELARKGDFLYAVGCHLNLTLGLPVRPQTARCRELCGSDGSFGPLRSHRWLSRKTLTLVADELLDQIDRCFQQGIQISHLDSHHHIHARPALLPVFSRVAREKGVPFIRPIRNFGRRTSPQRLWAAIGNAILRQRRQLGVRFFGYLSDLTGYIPTIQGGIELQVHIATAATDLDSGETEELALLYSGFYRELAKTQTLISYAQLKRRMADSFCPLPPRK